MRVRLLLTSLSILLVAGCASGGSEDAGVSPPSRDAGRTDSGAVDAAPAIDAGMEDAGPTPECSTDAECDDGDPCTSDACGDAYECEHAYTCECGDDAECAGMVTLGSCERAACVDGTCQPAPDPARDGASCDADGDGCTVDDTCSDGTCVAGEPVECGDSLSCTSDACVSTGDSSYRCDNMLAPSTCLISGSCVSSGTTRSGNACELCDPSASTSDWSLASVGTCDDGDVCTMDDTCSGGSCAGTPMTDAYEGNDTRLAAENLGTVSDTDGFPRGTFTATLYPSGDEDWYRYHDSDDFGGSIYPRVDLENVPAGSDYDLCAYFDCDSSLNSVSCESGTSSTYDGHPGCCSSGSGSASESVRLNPDCSGTDDSGTIYVRVWRFSGAPVCDDYTLEWGDD